jgi:hypothetical protein
LLSVVNKFVIYRKQFVIYRKQFVIYRKQFVIYRKQFVIYRKQFYFQVFSFAIHFDFSTIYILLKVYYLVLCSAGVFAIVIQATDHLVTFVCNFPLKLDTSYTIAANENNEHFKLTILKPTDECFICVRLTMLALKQDTILLSTKITIITKKTNRTVWSLWSSTEVLFITMRSNSTINLIKPSTKLNFINLTDGHAYDIRIAGAYVSNSKYDIVTSSPHFMQHEHTSVNISYTWTVCNLKLPLVVDRIASTFFPVGLGLSEYRILLFLGEAETFPNNFILFSIRLENVPDLGTKLPHKVTHKVTLLGSAPEYGIISETNALSVQFNSIGHIQPALRFGQLSVSELLSSMRNQCATFKYSAVYNTI